MIRTDYDEICSALWKMLPQEDKVRVIEKGETEIGPEFLGFVDTYYFLSKLIPKDWTVIDFGAAHNPQCYFFLGHKRYIAVEPASEVEMFKSWNCDIYRCTTEEFIDKELGKLGLDLGKTFAICNYIPPWYGQNSRKLVRLTFDNVYVFYP